VVLPYAWEYDDPDHPRPPEIRRVEAFLNTVDSHTYGEHAAKPAEARDLLRRPRDLQCWLADAGLVPLDRRATGQVTEEDLVAARRLRDGLRAWLVARQEVPASADAVETVQQLVDAMRLRVGFHDGQVGLEPAGRGVAGALEQLVADLVVAQATGALMRLKICSAIDCRFVYYDHSRSRTSRWCSMDTCGNRLKTRRYRSKRRSERARSVS
jgi:predicted RNA-binding Zn ribbon-like protein